MANVRFPLLAFLIAGTLSAGTLAAQVESFETFFERAQQDPAFRATRVAPDFGLRQEVAWEGAGKRISRTVPCGYRGAEANGWTILPGAAQLAGTGVTYASPDLSRPDRATVSLGPPQGPADGRHTFERRDGRWYHTATLVFTTLQPGEDPSPVPCGTSSQRNGDSSRPNAGTTAAPDGNATRVASCASDAIARATPLLALHFGEDNRISIDDEAKELASIRNPANPKQRFKVFEVWGFIYKGEYRMRFIYHASPVSGCVLMGQEILEHARL